MRLYDHLVAATRCSIRLASRWVLGHRIRARHPSLICDPTAIWDYGFNDIDSIKIGMEVSIGPFAEIVMYKQSPYSCVEGRLTLEDKVSIGTGSNVRAAGGQIHIGAGSALAQNCIVIAANHQILPGVPRMRSRWNEKRTGVRIGQNVWIGASSVLLPGASVGDNSVIAANSVVRSLVPSNELWGGVPARKIRSLPVDAIVSVS